MPQEHPAIGKKKPKIIPLDPTMVQTPTEKNASRNIGTGRSPMEFNQAFCDHSLPEDHTLAICALAEDLVGSGVVW